MAVPAHDERDFAFARKFSLPCPVVIKPVTTKKSGANSDKQQLPFTSDGILVSSGEYSNLTSAAARKAILETLKAAKMAEETINYKLR